MKFSLPISRAAISGALAGFALFAPNVFALNLAGSDLLSGEPENLLKPLAEKIPGGLKLTFDGSLMGEKHLRAGTADAALLLLADKAEVAEIVKGEWDAVPVAYQAAIVIVGKQNKIEQLDYAKLAGIFGKTTQSVDVRRWSDMPGSGLDMPIFCAATSRDFGMAVTIFRNRVLKDGDFKSAVTFFSNDAGAVENVASSANAIAIVAVPPANESVKILSVLAPDAGGNAYKPTASNLYNGDYALQLPLYFVFPKKNRATVRPAAEIIFGDQMAELLKKSGFVPVPKNLRINFVQKLDKAP